MIKPKDPRDLSDQEILRRLAAKGAKIHGWVTGSSNRAERWTFEYNGNWIDTDFDGLLQYIDI